MSTGMCRLCRSTNIKTIWVFDKRITNPDNMKEVIAVTTGVEICKEDKVTQMICSKCCQITLKMYKFRTTAKQNDEDLKRALSNDSKATCTADVKPRSSSPSSNSLHKSVLSICKKYPSIRIPAQCLSNDLDPLVVIKKIKAQKQVASKKTFSKEGIKILINKNKKREYEVATIENSPSGEKKRKLLSLEEERLLAPLNTSVTYDAENLFLAAKPPMQTHICKMCNKISYNLKELHKHQRQHLRCPICKKIFRNFEKKDQHYNFECPIKIMMNNLPTVQLEPIDKNLDLRLKYVDAFTSFEPLSQTEDEKSDTTTNAIDLEDDIVRTNIQNRTLKLVDSSEDEAEEIVVEEAVDVEKENTDGALDTPCVDITDDISSIKITGVQSVPIENLDSSAVVNVNTIVPESTAEAICEKPKESAKRSDNSSPIQLKPLIMVEGIQVNLNTKCSEVRLVKILLKHCSTLFSKRDMSTQTDLPSNTNISTITDNSCELKFFRRYLNYYKIPVTIRFGRFSACVEPFSCFGEKGQKKMQLWDNEVVVGAKPILNLKPRPPKPTNDGTQGKPLVLNGNNINPKLRKLQKQVMQQLNGPLEHKQNPSIPGTSVLKGNLNSNLNTGSLNNKINSQDKNVSTQVALPNCSSVPQQIYNSFSNPVLNNVLSNDQVTYTTVPMRKINVQTISIASATYATSVLNQNVVRNSPPRLVLLQEPAQTVPTNNLPVVPNNINILNGKTPSMLAKYFQTATASADTETSNEINLTSVSTENRSTTATEAPATSSIGGGYLRVKNMNELTYDPK